MINKKIFFVANSKSIHTVKWVDYFVDKGYDVYLATFSKVNNTKCKNTFFLGKKEVESTGRNYFYLSGISKLAKIFSEIKPDIINAHYSYSMGLIALLAKKKSKIQCNFSVVCHGSDILAPPNSFIFNKINRYVLKQSNKIFVVSNQIKDKLETMNIDINNVFVGQYGVNIQKQEIEKDIDILSNRIYNENSRIDLLLESLEAFKEKGLNIIFVLPNIKDLEFDKLVAQYPFITFYKYLEYDKMIDFLNRTNVYISATKSDGTSLSLLEAMSLECIPLVSNIVSNRSWILDSINGYLFDSKSQFINKLKKVLTLSNNEKKKILDINNRILSEKGSYKKQMQKFETILKK